MGSTLLLFKPISVFALSRFELTSPELLNSAFIVSASARRAINRSHQTLLGDWSAPAIDRSPQIESTVTGLMYATDGTNVLLNLFILVIYHDICKSDLPSCTTSDVLLALGSCGCGMLWHVAARRGAARHRIRCERGLVYSDTLRKLF